MVLGMGSYRWFRRSRGKGTPSATGVKRWAGQALAGPLAAATLAVMSGSAPASAAPKANTSRHSGVTDIVYWAGHASGALHAAVVAEVAKFNATHPNIHVTFIAKGASKHGLAAFEAGAAPNVAMISSYALAPMVQARAVLNLKPYLDGRDGLPPSQLHEWFYPVVWKDMQTGPGAQYLFPLEKKSVQVIYYNETLFKKAGIKAPPTSWSEVSSDLAKLTALGPGYHGMAWTPSVRQFLDMARSDGSPVFTTTTDRRTFDLDNPGGIKALTMLRDWVKSGYMIVTSGYQYQVGFGAGKIGLLVDASAGYTYDKSSAGGKFPMGGAPAPVGTSGHSSQYINGASLVMMDTGSAAQRAASWEFVKYMGSPSTNAYWDEHTNYLPLGPGTYKLMQAFYRTHPVLAATYSNPATWWFKPRTLNYEAAKTEILSEIEAALTGSTSVQAALKTIDTQGTKYLKGIIRA
jgi:sn-glycerol 3-phosphate transport system substrate-binding protein